MIAEATQEYINDNELSDDLYDIVRYCKRLVF